MPPTLSQNPARARSEPESRNPRPAQGPGPSVSPFRHPASRRELGRAHLWNGEPNRALEVLAPLHRSRPWDREVHSLMLDALFLLGLDENDFPWTVEPVVVRLGPGLMDRLHELLRADGGQVSLLDLLVAVAEEGHPAFRSEELLDRLEEDERFAVRRVGLAPECAVVSPGR